MLLDWRAKPFSECTRLDLRRFSLPKVCVSDDFSKSLVFSRGLTTFPHPADLWTFAVPALDAAAFVGPYLLKGYVLSPGVESDAASARRITDLSGW